MSKIFNFEVLTPLSDNLKMLHFDENNLMNWMSGYGVMSNFKVAENNLILIDELVCFYFHSAEFTHIDLCTKETYWCVFILAFVKF